MTQQRTALFGYILALFTLFALTFSSAQAAPHGVPVIVDTAQSRNLSEPLQLLGTLEARDSVEIKSTLSDYIEALLFRDGEQVKANQLLLRLRASEELQLLKQAQVLTQEAKRQYQRAQQLMGRGNMTQAKVDELHAVWQSAQAEQAVIEAQLQDREIRAPFAGTLGFRQVSQGALISSNQVITTLDDTEHLYLNLQVPEQLASQLKRGQTVRFQPQTLATLNQAYADKLPVYQATIDSISPRIDPESRLLPIRAEVDNREQTLKIGQLMRATIELQPRMGLTVPNTALLMVGERTFVYKIGKETEFDEKINKQKYKIEKIEVTLGQRFKSFSEIVSGLNEGEQIVSQGLLKLNAKSEVHIRGSESNQSIDEIIKGRVLKVPSRNTEER